MLNANELCDLQLSLGEKALKNATEYANEIDKLIFEIISFVSLPFVIL